MRHHHGMLSAWTLRELIGAFLRSLGWMAGQVVAGDLPGVALVLGVLGGSALLLLAHHGPTEEPRRKPRATRDRVRR